MIFFLCIYRAHEPIGIATFYVCLQKSNHWTQWRWYLSSCLYLNFLCTFFLVVYRVSTSLPPSSLRSIYLKRFWNSCVIQVSMSWSLGLLLLSGISQAIGLPRGPVSHAKLMSSTGNDTFSRICHSKPPQTHVISPIHSQRDCLEMHHSFKSQWA